LRSLIASATAVVLGLIPVISFAQSAGTGGQVGEMVLTPDDAKGSFRNYRFGTGVFGRIV